MNENKQLQENEIEALSAIYGDDWSVIDADNHVYLIKIKDDNNMNHEIKLQIRLPINYPLSEPPCYTLSAPWMSTQSKSDLTARFDNIYSKSKGDSIIYSWIEVCKEFLLQINDNQSDLNDFDQQDQLDRGLLNQHNEDQEESSTKEYEYHQYNNHHHQHQHQHHHHHHRNQNQKSNLKSKSSDNVILYHGEPISERRSTFQAHLSPVDCLEQMKEAVNKLMENKKISEATHNIRAYRIQGDQPHTFIQDCDDDGEIHAGSRLLHLLEILEAKNVLVVVSRWFGGTKLGADRFKHINNAARDLLDKCGYIVHANSEANQSGRKKKGK